MAIPALRIVEIGWDLNSCINVSSGVNLTPAMGGATKGLVRRTLKDTAGVQVGSAGAAATATAPVVASTTAGATGVPGPNGVVIKSEDGGVGEPLTVGYSRSSDHLAGMACVPDQGSMPPVMTEVENRKLTEEERIRRW